MLVCRVYAQTGGEQVVTLDYHERPLRSVLEDMGEKKGINFVFQDQLVDSKKITFHIENAELREAIILMLCRLKISCKIIQRNCFILFNKKASENKEYVKVVLKKSELAMDTSAVISEPKIISSTILKYPSAAIKDKKEGKVVLKVFVSKEGRVPKALIEKSSGCDALDSSSLAYTSSLRFIPAKANGLPINIWISILFNYLYNINQ
jgi:TonB family protein